MSEVLMILPDFSHAVEKPEIVIQEAVIPAKPDHHDIDVKEIQAVDTVFAQDHEKLSMLSMMGFWSAAMFVGDMAREYQRQVAEEETRTEDDEEVPRLPEDPV
jgi:hypothetical protein